MTIQQAYFDLLDHLGQTSTVAELHASNEGDNIVALRHDIDHDLELALEMAHHEWRLGLKATYYLLHTEQYWDDPKFPLLVQQLSEYGHEIGLHTNVLTSWMRGEIDDPNMEISRVLTHIRNCSVQVSGVCAHGDKMCYEQSYVNYWLWKELRPNDPAKSEEGVSAEGIFVDDPSYQIPYPKNHELVREDGERFPLWSISMEELGLAYDAAKLEYDHYWTDSGGNWDRTGDPMKVDCSKGRPQVLVHPWWWRGETKKTFVLSPARSGSKWLANYIDKATSAVGLHDWTLNHTREENDYPLDNKATNEFPSLIQDSQDVASRLRAARAHHTIFKRDVVECNVYLEAVVDLLRANIPDATMLYLNRNPMDVVRSILNEGWYEVPDESAHRTDSSEGWAKATQLERACRYVRSAIENIAEATDQELLIEEMATNSDCLQGVLFKLGIVVHPLLAIEACRKTAHENEELPSWSKQDKEVASRLLSETTTETT